MARDQLAAEASHPLRVMFMSFLSELSVCVGVFTSGIAEEEARAFQPSAAHAGARAVSSAAAYAQGNPETLYFE